MPIIGFKRISTNYIHIPSEVTVNVICTTNKIWSSLTTGMGGVEIILSAIECCFQVIHPSLAPLEISRPAIFSDNI